MGALSLTETQNVWGSKNEHGIPMPGSGSGTGTFSPKTYQGGFSVNDDRADSGLYLMGHRHYAAELGRFISRDPIGFAGGWNLFNGASANPVTSVDPSGLLPAGPVGDAIQVVLPSIISEILNPTIRQTGGLPEGALGQTGYLKDGTLVILIDKDSTLRDQLNILSNECVHYGHLKLRGNRKMPGDQLVKSEMASEIVDAIVGSVVPPDNMDLRRYQAAVRSDLMSGRVDRIWARTIEAHDIDFMSGISDHEIIIELPKDAERWCP
jgi:RHS repeat-associated protein